MMTDDELYRFFYPDKLKLALQRLSCGKNTVRSVKRRCKSLLLSYDCQRL